LNAHDAEDEPDNPQWSPRRSNLLVLPLAIWKTILFYVPNETDLLKFCLVCKVFYKMGYTLLAIVSKRVEKLENMVANFYSLLDSNFKKMTTSVPEQRHFDMALLAKQRTGEYQLFLTKISGLKTAVNQHLIPFKNGLSFEQIFSWFLENRKKWEKLTEDLQNEIALSRNAPTVTITIIDSDQHYNIGTPSRKRGLILSRPEFSPDGTKPTPMTSTRTMGFGFRNFGRSKVDQLEYDSDENDET